MSTLYLIRHGDIAMHSGQHRFVGQLDPALSAQGREQMRMLAGHPALQGIERMLTSPLLRCRESAAILSARLGCGAADVVSEFAEIALGEWEGLTPTEVKNRFPGEYAHKSPIGQGLPSSSKLAYPWPPAAILLRAKSSVAICPARVPCRKTRTSSVIKRISRRE